MTDATTPDPSGIRPCWWSEVNTETCPAPDTGYELDIERVEPPAIGTTVIAECLVVST